MKKNIIMLDAATLGKDIECHALSKYGNMNVYNTTNREDTAERIKDAEIIFTNKVHIGREEIDCAPDLKYIGILATGTNNVDLKYAAEKGITVTNVSGYSTQIVAQHTFAILFSLMEPLAYYDNYIKTGAYSKQPLFTNLDRSFNEICGKTWGIIGLGEIGRNVAGIATAFGCRVIYYSTTGNNNNSEYERVEFDRLLAESDIISIHAPLTENTRHLMNNEAFEQMKNTAFLINVGRGPIVDENALRIAIDEGKIAGAGMDVFEQEPLPETSPLMQINNKDRLIMTPHIAWASKEARKRLMDEAIKNLDAYMKGEKRNVVNPLL